MLAAADILALASAWQPALSQLCVMHTCFSCWLSFWVLLLFTCYYGCDAACKTVHWKSVMGRMAAVLQLQPRRLEEMHVMQNYCRPRLGADFLCFVDSDSLRMIRIGTK
jgi:hypothetical protein